MSLYAVLAKFLPEEDLATLPERSARVKAEITRNVPSLEQRWRFKYKVVGNQHVDTIDVVEAAEVVEVERAANIIGRVGRCRASVAHATPWLDFIGSVAGPDHPAARSPNPTPSPNIGRSDVRGFVIFSSFLSDASLGTLAERSLAVRHNLMAALPELNGRWACELALFNGPYDAVDVLLVDSIATANRAADIIARHGRCNTAVAEAVPWAQYLSAVAGKSAAA